MADNKPSGGKPINFKSLKDILNNKDKFIKQKDAKEVKYRDRKKEETKQMNRELSKQASRQDKKQSAQQDKKIGKQNKIKNVNFANKQIKVFGKDITNVNVSMVPRTKKQLVEHHAGFPKLLKNKSLSIQNIIAGKKEKEREKQQNYIAKNGKKDYDTYKQQIIIYLLKQQKYTNIKQHLQKQNKEKTNIDMKKQLEKCHNVFQSQLNKIFILHHSLGLKDQTLYVAMTYIKQYVNNFIEDKIEYANQLIQNGQNRKLTLICVTCLWIASKYEQIYPPKSKYFARFMQNTSIDQLKQMESQIVTFLQFNFTRTTSYYFLLMLSKQDTNIFCLANYILQSLYYNNLFYTYPSSLIALAAIKISTLVFTTNIKFGMQLEQFTKYTKEQISQCFKALCRLLQPDSLKSAALKKKFADPALFKVSKICLMPK